MQRRPLRSSALLLAFLLALPAVALLAPAGPALGGIGSGAITFDNYPTPFPGSAGETSLGVDPYTDNVMFNRFLREDRVHFDDGFTPPKPTWTDVSPPLGFTTIDPLAYTDRDTGRTYWVQNLAAVNHVYFTQAVLSPVDGSIVVNDGDQWLPTEPSSTFPAFDHQNVGSGPHSLLGAVPNLKQLGVPAQVAGVANAMYTCGQLGFTLCQRSDDNGVTWGPPVIANAGACQGLVGHIAVDNTGVVYVPDRGCGSGVGVLVSTDNGITFAARTFPGSGSRGFAEPDPSVAVGNDDTIFVGYRNEVGNNVGLPAVTISRDHGVTWSAPISPDPTGTIKEANFPMMLAGDKDRAAFAFYGATEAGDYQSSGYAGVWHLYISFTYDGGKTWTLVDATPNDPVQRGCIWMQGGGSACRNLLDFQGASLDSKGRVVVGYADGCTSAQCTGPGGTPGDSRSSKGVIARQTTGRTLYAAFDR